MKTCSASQFSNVVRDHGGKNVPLCDGQHAAKLGPLQVLAGASELVTDPDDIAYLSCKSADTVRVFPQALFACPEVNLYGTGVAAVEAHVCRSTLRTRKFLRRATEQFEKAHENIRTSACSTTDAEPALMLAPLEQFNYSHWILEAVPKLGLFEKAFGKMPDKALMVGSALPFHAESVAYVSASTRLQRIKLTPVTVHNLSFTTSLARSVAELNPEIIRFYDAVLREKFGGQKPARTRLYISRANARYRRVENEPELIEELAKLHFTAVDPGAHTFDAQVAMFWNADVVVGAHGAGLTNLVFAPNCRFAFELLSSGFRDRSTYAHICRHRKIAYGATSWEPVLKGDVEDSTDPEGWPGHRSFRVDVQRVLQELRQLL